MQEIKGRSKITQAKMLAYVAKLGKLTKKLDLVIKIAYAIEARWGLRADLIMCQVFKETGWGTSELFTRYNNFAGIGHTGITMNLKESSSKPPAVEGTDWYWSVSSDCWTQGLTNADEIMGIEQVFAHHTGYTNPFYSLKAHFYNKRYDLLHRLRDGKPPLVTINDYNSQWAKSFKDGVEVTNHYGDDLEILYNTIDQWRAS